ncbi:MAG: serine/threonine dehydratase [Acidimicrobiales bacterium]
MLVGPDHVNTAAGRIGGVVRSTPILVVPATDLVDDLDPDVTVVLKLELVQHSGSFKARGAGHAVISADIGPSGVVAASGGNHGAAVAWAARRLGHPATIFVPTITAPAKRARLDSYGATVVEAGANYAEAHAACLDHLAGWSDGPPPVEIAAYDDPVVVAGAGTLARELSRQHPGLDAVLVACGGGGLAAGTAAWFGTTAELVACETTGTAAYAAARTAGQPVEVPVSGIAADALGASRLGALPFAQLQAVDARSAVVTDDGIRTAMAALWDRFRLVVEPAAAAPLAALLSGQYAPRPGSTVAVVLCGANTARLPVPPPVAAVNRSRPGGATEPPG